MHEARDRGSALIRDKERFIPYIISFLPVIAQGGAEKKLKFEVEVEVGKNARKACKIRVWSEFECEFERERDCCRRLSTPRHVERVEARDRRAPLPSAHFL